MFSPALNGIRFSPRRGTFAAGGAGLVQEEAFERMNGALKQRVEHTHLK